MLLDEVAKRNDVDQNSRGPSKDPCGTPVYRGIHFEVELLTTCCDRLVT